MHNYFIFYTSSFFYKIGVTTPHTVSNFPLMMRRISIAGSLIGGIKVTTKKIFLKTFACLRFFFHFTRKLKKLLIYALSMAFIRTAKLLKPRILTGHGTNWYRLMRMAFAMVKIPYCNFSNRDLSVLNFPFFSSN